MHIHCTCIIDMHIATEPKAKKRRELKFYLPMLRVTVRTCMEASVIVVVVMVVVDALCGYVYTHKMM